MAERWRDMPGYEGLYQASNMGRVRSLPREVSHWRGGTRTIPGRVMKLQVVSAKMGVPYLEVKLAPGNDVPQERMLVHRAVLRAFVRPLPDGHHSRHLDGDPQNNCHIQPDIWHTCRERG